MSLVSDAISARGTRWACHVRLLCPLLDRAQPAWTGGASRSTRCVRQRRTGCIFSPCSGSCWCMGFCCKSPFGVEHLQNDTEEKWTYVHHLEIDAVSLHFFLVRILDRLFLGVTLQACACRRPLACWWQRWKQVVQFTTTICIVLFFSSDKILCFQIFEYGSATARHDVGRCDGANILQTLLIVFGSLVALATELRSWWALRYQWHELGEVKIRWVKVDSVRKWNAAHRRTPRFQDLQEDELVEEDNARSFKEWLLCKRYVVLHAWLQPDHPDPERVQLSALVRELTKCDSWKFWKRIMGCHDVVFFDYSSLPQKGPAGEERKDEEKRLLKNALKGMNVLYSYSLFRVLREARVVLDGIGDQHFSKHDRQQVFARGSRRDKEGRAAGAARGGPREV